MRIPGTNVRIGPHHDKGYSNPVYHQPHNHHFQPAHQTHMLYHDVQGAKYSLKNMGHHITGRAYY